MTGLKKFFGVLGRIMISSIFILSAVNKMFEWQKTQTALINLFCDWQSYAGSFVSISKLFSKLIAWAPEILVVFTAIEIIAALLIFFGIREKFGAFLLILIFVPATLILHPFWFLSGIKRSVEMVVFLKNLSILGGLFLLMIFGSKMSDRISLPPIISKPRDLDEN